MAYSLGTITFALRAYSANKTRWLTSSRCFLRYYNKSYHFPGGHTPTADEVCEWYVPLVEQLLVKFPLPADGTRYFLHFKGNKYRYVRTAFDSETKERMVVYQALYGDQNYWVRPEKMFFKTIERDGGKFPRFTEIDS